MTRPLHKYVFFQRTLFMAYPGNLVGALAVLTGEPSFFTIRAYSDVRLVYITKQDYYW